MKIETAQFAFWLLAFLGLAQTGATHPLDVWYSRFTNSAFYSATYGNGGFVAVGSAGAIAHSIDGNQWTATNPTTQVLHDVTYGNGKFIAVGSGGTILTSSNAINWEDHSPGTNLYLQKIFWGNSRFIALGYTITPAFDYSLVSTDGVAWNTYFIASNKPTGELTFGNGLFVYPQTTGTNLLSTDGIAWWSQPCGLTNSLYLIGSGGNKFVAFDIRNSTFISADGTNWIFRGVNSLLRPEGLAYGNGFWVAVGRGSRASYSSDLVNWTSVTNPQTMAFGACFGNGSFVSAGSTLCQSAPLIQLQAMPGVRGAIDFSGPTGVVYQIQTRDSLDQAWQITSNITVNTSPYLWTDPSALDHSQRFYRVLSP